MIGQLSRMMNSTGHPSFLLDMVPGAAAAYGLRRLRSAYNGPIINLRRSSDNAQSDFYASAAGDLETAAITAWLSGATGYVSTWYDQSGNGNNATQTTAADQSNIQTNSLNGHAILASANDAPFGSTSGSVNFSGAVSVSAIVKATSAASTYLWTSVGAAYNSPGGPQLVYDGSGNIDFLTHAADTIAVATTPTSWHNFLGTTPANGVGVNHLYVDGVSTAGSSTSHVTANNTLFAVPTNSVVGDGSCAEVIYWPFELSAAQAAIIYTNQKAYWGTP